MIEGEVLTKGLEVMSEGKKNIARNYLLIK